MMGGSHRASGQGDDGIGQGFRCQQGLGPCATLLVTGGTLKVGDALLIGEHFGKVRALIDDHGRRIKEAPPATPVKCTGLSGVPEAGAEFRVMLDEKRARTLAEQTAQEKKEQELLESTAKGLVLDILKDKNATLNFEGIELKFTLTKGNFTKEFHSCLGLLREDLSRILEDIQSHEDYIASKSTDNNET